MQCKQMRFQNTIQTTKALNNNQAERDYDKVLRLSIWQKSYNNSKQVSTGTDAKTSIGGRLAWVQQGGDDTGRLTFTGSHAGRNPLFETAEDVGAEATAEKEAPEIGWDKTKLQTLDTIARYYIF